MPKAETKDISTSICQIWPSEPRQNRMASGHSVGSSLYIKSTIQTRALQLTNYDLTAGEALSLLHCSVKDPRLHTGLSNILLLKVFSAHSSHKETSHAMACFAIAYLRMRQYLLPPWTSDGAQAYLTLRLLACLLLSALPWLSRGSPCVPSQSQQGYTRKHCMQVLVPVPEDHRVCSLRDITYQLRNHRFPARLPNHGEVGE
jgi:hypothetical protein